MLMLSILLRHGLCPAHNLVVGHSRTRLLPNLVPGSASLILECPGQVSTESFKKSPNWRASPRSLAG